MRSTFWGAAKEDKVLNIIVFSVERKESGQKRIVFLICSNQAPLINLIMHKTVPQEK